MTNAPKIIILAEQPAHLVDKLRTRIPDAVVKGCDDYVEMSALVPEFTPDIVFSITFSASRHEYPRDILKGPEGPKWISVGGSGVDHMKGWDPERLTVTNSAGVAASMMAEYVFGTALHFTLDIPGLEQDRKARVWPPRLMTPLRGKTCLIVGLGHTGQEIAAKARAFGMHVIGTRARPADMENVDEVHTSDDLPKLWPRADLIAVSVPLLPTTRKLIDARAFAAMKSTAILVDVSRGGVIDQAALINAMRSNTIAGAALDVFETEPLPEDSPIWSLENVIISPHCSSVFSGWETASFDMFCDNVERWRRGAPLFNVVDPARGY